ncbi:uncharacterized protein LOC132038192 [Lycium ferocissimum]|uniref:uncharacterized protein LOC132038192 n=1 Tax=Lycium ferocissimum TaxID=112874 RepID=UPI002814B239|nr:uncharacterized protein LOC132038192 [Lycium ferocissimum]
MVRKILGTRDYVQTTQTADNTTRSMIKHLYLQLIGDHPKVPWRNLVFQNTARPKTIFIMWLQIQNRSLTADRLSKWNIQLDPTYQMCHSANNTRDHLFFECTFAHSIWQRLMQWLQFQWPAVQSWQLQYQIILQVTKGKTMQAKMFRLVYSEFIAAIWWERNTRIFEKREKHGEQIAREIACLCNVRAPPTVKARLMRCRF